MRQATKVLLAACVTCGVLEHSEASASTDPPGLYDARGVALGGTGSSYIENGASVYLNPAALDGIKTFAGTLTLSPIKSTLKTPVMGPPPASPVKSDSSFFPLFLAGAGFRLSDRIVAGLAVYPTAGFGATYKNITPTGDELSFSIAQIEASPAVSVKVAEGLSLGLGYRITYTHESAHTPATGPMMPAADLTLNGTSFFGLHAGVYYRPTDDLHLAFTYRSRVSSSLSGTTESGGAKLDTKSDFSAPDRFRVGASYALLDKQLFLAADVKYLLYSVSNKTLDTTVTTPGGPVTQSQRLDWKDVIAFGLGVEYAVVPVVAIRAGYSLSTSATNETAPSPFTPPPGLLHGIHAGAGLKLPLLDLDLGGDYTFGSKTIAANPSYPIVVPGEYSMGTLLLAVSGTYHM
jgi:long-subunit fatty acid transport protein